MDDFWHQLSQPIIGLAPMDGVTDEPARQIQCLVAKPDMMYTEFVSVEGFARNPDHFKKTLFFQDNERPIVTQLFGYTPKLFFEAILKINEMNFDGIDINMGCPAKSVLERGGGGALIGNYDLAAKIIESSISAIKKSKKSTPLSIKTRIGNKEIQTSQWISFLGDFPISEITVHGRLLKQGNSGAVLWDEIQKAAEIAHNQGIICLGNGGIKSLSEARQKSTKYGLDGVLIGQAALGNPWVFKEDYVPLREEIFQIIIEHSRLVENFYPKERFVTVLKHLGWYPKGFPNCIKLKVELLKARNHTQVVEIIKKFKRQET